MGSIFLIESIIEFGDTIVREIMRPRPDIISVDSGETLDMALDEAFEHGVSRLPVMRNDDEDNEDGGYDDYYDDEDEY